MPTLLFQILTITVDLILFIFIGFYLFSLHRSEKKLKQKETKTDTEYHQIVDNALSRERKIMEDAIAKANQIISGANYLNQNYTQTLDTTLSQMANNVQKNMYEISKRYTVTYEDYLRQIATGSLDDFQTITKHLAIDLQNQIKQLNQALVTTIEKDTASYKQMRLKQVESSVQGIVQRASREILNKTISLDNHHDLVIAALEKAKGEGILE